MPFSREDLSTPVVDLQKIFQPSELSPLREVLMHGQKPSVNMLKPLLLQVLHVRPLNHEDLTDLLEILTVSRPVPLLKSRVHWTLKCMQRTGQVQLDSNTLCWMPQNPSDRSSEPSWEPQTVNATGRWLNEHLARRSDGSEAPLLSQLRIALTRRFQISHTAGMIEDHIHNYIVRAIRRDAFAKMLGECPLLPYGKVISYAVNSAKTDIRDMGVEPLCREGYGARTEQERLKTPQPKARVRRPVDTDGAIFSLEDPHSPEDWLDFEKIWTQVQNMVQRKKPHAWERYSQLLRLKLEGYSTDEIAEKTGVGSNRAAWMLQEARKCVRKANPVRLAALTSA